LFFELPQRDWYFFAPPFPTQADTGTCAAGKPCFLSGPRPEAPDAHSLCCYTRATRTAIVERTRRLRNNILQFRRGVLHTHCADERSIPPQVISLAIAVSSPVAKQPANMRRSVSPTQQEGLRSKRARNAWGRAVGSRGLLLFAVGALLLRGVTASATGCFAKAIVTGTGMWHTCALMVRRSLEPCHCASET